MQDWLTFGQADVMALLIRYGYGTANPTDANGLTWLEKMNCLRSCMDVEMTYPITEWGKPNPRMMMFKEQWDEGVMLVESGRLTALGISAGTVAAGALSAHLEFTGTSYSRKISREDETDRVAGKFQRRFGQSRRTTEYRFDPNAPRDQA